uniref:Uncharacterized protein n=1 Tax=Salvator merianae TaxID=96440 RepID=A0A8D0DIG1_SALMN
FLMWKAANEEVADVAGRQQARHYRLLSELQSLVKELPRWARGSGVTRVGASPSSFATVELAERRHCDAPAWARVESRLPSLHTLVGRGMRGPQVSASHSLLPSL